jgi:hypothetical protein
MGGRGGGRFLANTSLLSTKVFGCTGRSEENWCYAVNSKCSINVKPLFVPDVLTG